MTQKELSYVEDAITHEDIIIKICTNILNKLEDSTLIEFMQKEIEKHQGMKQKMLNLLEEKANG